jgi:protein-tyrosine phosphatase
MNTRDIGGILNEDGKMLKDKVFIRSDGLRFLSESDKLFLLYHNIHTQIDLRTPSVIKKYPSCLQEDRRFDYYSFSLTEGSMESLKDIEIPVLYMKMIKNYQTFHDIFKIIALCDGGVIYSCTAGKDRTGILTFLLLSLCQVDDEIIINDYKVSEIYIDEMSKKFISLGLDFLPYYGDSKEENIRKFIKLFYQEYHDVWEYFHEIGLDDPTIIQIRTKLLGE